MAKVTNVNLSPATGSIAMFDLLVFLRDQMLFTIQATGDGSANFGTNIITSGGAVANGLGNSTAYFVARDPAGVYEWMFQRNSSDTSWEVLISPLTGFGAAASATVRPTATDEKQIINTTLFTTNGSYRWHLTGDTAAIGSTVAVYPWRAFSTLNGSGAHRTLIMHEPLAVGSYPELVGTRAAPTTGEPDPSVWVACYDATGDCVEFLQNTPGLQSDFSATKGLYCMNGVNGNEEAFINYQCCSLFSNQSQADLMVPATTLDALGTDPRDSSDPIFPILFSRSTRFFRQVGFKGFSATVRMKGVAREYPDTLDIGGERYVYLGDLLIPYENGTAPLV